MSVHICPSGAESLDQCYQIGMLSAFTALGIATMTDLGVRKLHRGLGGDGQGVFQLAGRAYNHITSLITRTPAVAPIATGLGAVELTTGTRDRDVREEDEATLSPERRVPLEAERGTSRRLEEDRGSVSPELLPTTSDVHEATREVRELGSSSASQDADSLEGPSRGMATFLPLIVRLDNVRVNTREIAYGIANGRQSCGLTEVIRTVTDSDPMLIYLIRGQGGGDQGTQVRECLADMANVLRNPKADYGSVYANEVVAFRQAIGIPNDNAGRDPQVFMEALLRSVGEGFGHDRFFAYGEFDTALGVTTMMQDGINERIGHDQEVGNPLVDGPEGHNKVLVLRKVGDRPVHPDPEVTIGEQRYRLCSVIAQVEDEVPVLDRRGRETGDTEKTAHFTSYAIRDNEVYLHNSSAYGSEETGFIPATIHLEGLYGVLDRAVPEEDRGRAFDASEQLERDYDDLVDRGQLFVYEKVPAPRRREVPVRAAVVTSAVVMPAERPHTPPPAHVRARVDEVDGRRERRDSVVSVASSADSEEFQDAVQDLPGVRTAVATPTAAEQRRAALLAERNATSAGRERETRRLLSAGAFERRRTGTSGEHS